MTIHVYINHAYRQDVTLEMEIVEMVCGAVIVLQLPRQQQLLPLLPLQPQQSSQNVHHMGSLNVQVTGVSGVLYAVAQRLYLAQLVV